MAFSPDGRYLVTGRANGAVQVWDARTGRQVGTLGTHDRAIRGVVFSRDGRHLASASGDGVVKLWDATRLDEKQEASPHPPCAGPRAVFERGVQPGRPAPGDGGRGEHGQDLGRADRPGAANPPGTQRGRLRRGLQPRPEAGGSPRRARTAP